MIVTFCFCERKERKCFPLPWNDGVLRRVRLPRLPVIDRRAEGAAEHQDLRRVGDRNAGVPTIKVAMRFALVQIGHQ